MEREVARAAGRREAGNPEAGNPEAWATKDRKPTVRQLIALAAVLCERAGEPFPGTRLAASVLIERLRLETGHPAPRLDDVPPRGTEARAAGTRRVPVS